MSKIFKIVNLCPLKCLNGGTCYVNKSNSPACQCQRGYLGLSCEQDICLQALLTGTCTDRYQRYYYNALFKSCQPFLYTGCGGTIIIYLKTIIFKSYLFIKGNQNNFGDPVACNNACEGH